jgi:hypothetical protein
LIREVDGKYLKQYWDKDKKPRDYFPQFLQYNNIWQHLNKMRHNKIYFQFQIKIRDKRFCLRWIHLRIQIEKYWIFK